MNKSQLHIKLLYSCIIVWYIIIIMTIFWNMFFLFDLFSHFYLQYFCIATLILILTIFLRHKNSFIYISILCLFIVFKVTPVFTSADTVEKVDIYYINANYYINNSQQLVDDIQKYQPRYIAVVELNASLEEEIKEIIGTKNNYIHREGVLSYGLFTNEEVIAYEKKGTQYPFWKFVTWDGVFFLIHPLPPMSRELTYLQQENFQEIRDEYERSSSQKKFIIWDFNSSPYSKIFLKYFRDLDYKILYTWQRWNWMSIPIDHILWPKEYFSVTTNDLDASDHSPLLIDLR